MIQKCAAPPICDGLRVRECRNGAVGAVIDDCSADGACSQGRCMSPACAAADRVRNSFQGCVFYTAETDNVASDAAAPTSFLIANPGAEKATVTLEEQVAGGAWMMKDMTTVPPGGAARLSVAGHEVVTSGFNAADGLRMLSTRPVTIAQIESDDRDQGALSSGGTMLLPTHVLGSHYMVMTYPQSATGASVSAAGAPDGAGRVLIVGTEPRTTVNVKLSANAPTAITGMDANQFQFMLGDGDVFQFWTGADGEDLSGTDINADQPIAVFSGNIVTTYGRTAAGVHSPDMAHEQMPPIASWSVSYVAASLPPQPDACNTLIGQPGASVWRVLAALDGTTINFAVPDGAGPPPDPIRLDAGEAREFVASGDFVASAKQAFLMTQGMDCEPSLSLAVSADMLLDNLVLDDLTFAVLPWFDQIAAVVRKQGDPIMLDGSPIPDAQFTSAGGGFEVARVSLLDCPSSYEACVHRLQGHFGVTVRGMDVLASYALTMPTWTSCRDMTDVSCID